eukprot:m.203943 g.203943  ORF g.203943 m.203943 type:complete len:468 (-) comp10695_c0_seq3:1666-3069(-)
MLFYSSCACSVGARGSIAAPCPKRERLGKEGERGGKVVGTSRFGFSCEMLRAVRALSTQGRALRAPQPVYVVGVGMTKFEKPGARAGWDYPAMVKEAGTAALADCGLEYAQVEQAVVGYVYGESTSGNRAAYELGLTGIPITNVNNNCSTGSTALYHARSLIAGGLADCVAAIGFEKMQKGSLAFGDSDRESPVQRHLTTCANVNQGMPKVPPAPFMFAVAGLEHMRRYGTTKEHFAKIAYKNHKHSVNNPYAQFQKEYSLEEILAAPPVTEPLTRLMCSPTSDGAGVAILCSKEFVIANGLQDKAVEIVGQAMTTDNTLSFQGSAINCIGADMTHRAASKAFEQAGLSASDVDVVELHDCFATNELITYEGLGLCEEGKGGELIDNGDVTYGGKFVVNPSGGLISKGHPLGATGLAQCAEMTWQVRGTADKRQVTPKNPTVGVIGLQHNLGLGGAAVVTVYRKADL